MSSTVILEGISWDHGRAFPPAVAAAQRYEETHPGVRIRWEKHSLHDFGHTPIDVLCQKFDILIIDHPSMGFAHSRKCLLPLRDRIGVSTYHNLETHSVGESFLSYCWADDLWALPIDAACPAAFWRADCIRCHGPPPATWSELIRWADAGRVLAPGFGPDLVLHLLSLCATEDETCGRAPDCFAPEALALESLERLRELFSRLPPDVFKLNPIAIHERLSAAGGVGPDYCPFAFAYNNYARSGYGTHPLTFGDPPAAPSGKALRTVIGGTGLAISARCNAPEIAVDFACFLASENVQRTIYTQAGGQPGHLSAWTDALNNQLTGNFFNCTLPAMQRAWTRPRFDGFLAFQEQAGLPVREWIQSGGSTRDCLKAVNEVWRQSYASKNC
jgi:multiple sugar transport system substrate-binding protein